MKIDPNAPAFPIPSSTCGRFAAVPGLTIRAHFAAMAIQGILAATPQDGRIADAGSEKDMAAVGELSVGYADALIAELNK